MNNHGPNYRRLLAHKVARDTVDKYGPGLANHIHAIKSGALAEFTRDGMTWVDQAIEAIRRAPDNPYGNDEEVIAGAVLAELQKARPSLFR